MKKVLGAIMVFAVLFSCVGSSFTAVAEATYTQVKKSGNIVQCNIATGTEFDVSVKIIPELINGSFQGFESIRVVHCGENLVDMLSDRDKEGWTKTENGITTTVQNGIVSVKGTNISASSYNAFDNTFFDRTKNNLPKGAYSAPRIPQLSITADSVMHWPEYGSFSLPGKINKVTRWALFVSPGETVDFSFPLVLMAGQNDVKEYIPYKGTTHIVNLPEKCYGGTVDLTKGEMTVTHGFIESYNGEALPDGWLSSTGSLSLGAQVVYPLLQPYSTNLSVSERFVAHEGVNTLHTCDGLITVTGVTESVLTAGDTASKIDCTKYLLPVLKINGDVSAATKKNAVTVSYAFGEMEGTCSVKLQGSSSLAYPKKNYTIDFDRAFEASEGWGEQSSYCLKANFIDFSHSRNVVSAKLWGQVAAVRKTVNSTLAAAPNYGAVDGFPVSVMMNDEFMGIYTFNIPKAAWMANMGKGAKECILCAGGYSEPTLFMGEADFVEDFDIEYISTPNDTEWAKNSLNNLIAACKASDGSDLKTTIAQLIDLESVIDYYIFTVLIRGDDMVNKNYLLMTYDGKKWIMGAYDMDSTFGLWWNGQKFVCASEEITFEDIAKEHILFKLVKTYMKDELKERYRQLRNGVLSEDNVALSFRNFAGKIPRPLLDEDSRIWTTIPNTNTNNADQIIDWYRLRCAAIDAEIENM